MTPSTPKRSALSGDLIVLFAIALVDILVHVLFSGQYGFHRDELDIVMNARQLDWGLLPALGQGIVVLLTGLMARGTTGQRGVGAQDQRCRSGAAKRTLLVRASKGLYTTLTFAQDQGVTLLLTTAPRWPRLLDYLYHLSR